MARPEWMAPYLLYHSGQKSDQYILEGLYFHLEVDKEKQHK